MDNDYIAIINFINKIDGLKKVLRYKECESFCESTADHSWRATILAFTIKNLPEIAKLDLDWDRILKMLLIHDLPELETNLGDVSANILDANQIIAKEKNLQEGIAINELEKLISIMCPDFSNLLKEYQERKTPESKFSSAINRLEATMHILNSDISEYRDMDYTIKHLSKVLKDCPELEEFVKIVKTELKRKCKKNNIEWRTEYNSPVYRN